MVAKRHSFSSVIFSQYFAGLKSQIKARNIIDELVTGVKHVVLFFFKKSDMCS